jgi:hypothetical protein
MQTVLTEDGIKKVSIREVVAPAFAKHFKISEVSAIQLLSTFNKIIDFGGLAPGQHIEGVGYIVPNSLNKQN